MRFKCQQQSSMRWCTSIMSIIKFDAVMYFKMSNRIHCNDAPQNVNDEVRCDGAPQMLATAQMRWCTSMLFNADNEVRRDGARALEARWVSWTDKRECWSMRMMMADARYSLNEMAEAGAQCTYRRMIQKWPSQRNVPFSKSIGKFVMSFYEFDLN
jgi:hypothetical protein